MNESQISIAIGVFIAWTFLIFLMFFFGSVVYAFRRYCDMRIARAAERKRSSKVISRLLRRFARATVRYLSRPTAATRPPDFSLWETPPQYRIALSHRCLKVGRSRHTRLFVSDYPDGLSSAYIKRGNKRTNLDAIVSSGASGDTELLQVATSHLSA